MISSSGSFVGDIIDGTADQDCTDCVIFCRAIAGCISRGTLQTAMHVWPLFNILAVGQDLPLITTIAVSFTAAWVLGILTQKIGLSPIVGYLLAGIVVGPHTPGFVGDIKL